MKKSKWYMYVIPGLILSFFGFMAIAILFGPETVSTTPTFSP